MQAEAVPLALPRPRSCELLDAQSLTNTAGTQPGGAKLIRNDTIPLLLS